MQQKSVNQTILFACVLVTAVIAAETSRPLLHGDAASYSDAIDSPPVIFIGRSNSELVRCSHDGICENFHQANSFINSLLVSGEYVYAGLESGEILRCHINVKQSCNTFYKSSSSVWSLASGKGYLFAGLRNQNIILRCEMYQPSCRTLHKFDYPIYALNQINNRIYAGLGSGKLMQCSLSISNKCSEIFMAQAGITGLASMGTSMYILTNERHLSKCSGATITDCVHSRVATGSSWGIAAFNGSLYVQGYQMGICKLVNDAKCENFINTTISSSVAMAYGSNHLRNQYKNEHVTCEQSAQQCQLVTYFNEPERAAFEVKVKEGRLYNSTDSLVNTSDADQGHAGPAAVFIMAPDGKIYLSNHHQGAIHTSSFLAGNPISGAGEIIVENGVVRKIVACSAHYEPTLELNAQVIQSLFTQGYTDPIVSEKCPDVVEHDENRQVVSSLEDLDKKLQIMYTMQKSLDDLITIYAREVNALKEKTDNRINEKLGTCTCSNVTNGQN